MKSLQHRKITEVGQKFWLAPSLLAADFAHLAEDVAVVEQAGVPVLHIDVMDGHFVPNLSMGPCVVQSLRSCSRMLFDVHLMISCPERYVVPFAEAGADHITIHVESAGNLSAVLQQIRELGCSAGISLRPGTPVEAVFPYLPLVDMVLVMTVEPGFGGQSFMPGQLGKIRALRQWAQERNPALQIEVDGGIQSGNIAQVREAGANGFVAGSSVFRPQKMIAENVEKLSFALH